MERTDQTDPGERTERTERTEQTKQSNGKGGRNIMKRRDYSGRTGAAEAERPEGSDGRDPAVGSGKFDGYYRSDMLERSCKSKGLDRAFHTGRTWAVPGKGTDPAKPTEPGEPTDPGERISRLPAGPEAS
jgi:hypothetical protein